MINFQHPKKPHVESTCRRIIISALFFLTTYPSIPTAFAADMPKNPESGEAEYITTYTGTVHQSIELQNGKRAEIRELIGLTQGLSSPGQYDDLTVRCLVYFEATNTRPHVSGHCTYMDTDGDKIFQRFAAGKIDLLGGTGKYEGTTGTGSITNVQNFQSHVDQIRQFKVLHEISWKMK